MTTSTQPAEGGEGKPKKFHLALAGFALGIAAIFPTEYRLFFSFSAIVVSHFAHSRVINFPDRFDGRAMALTGLVLGYALTVFWLLLAPDICHHRADPRTIKCAYNLKEIGIAARSWAADHGRHFPTEFVQFQNKLVTPKTLWCPKDGKRKPAAEWKHFTSNRVSYVIVSPGTTLQDPDTVFARCPIHGHELTADGSVHYMRAAFRKELCRSSKQINIGAHYTASFKK